MQTEKLYRKLIKVAQADQPGRQVPLAFEKRIMANLQRVARDPWANWMMVLWRAAYACVGLSALLGAWTFYMAQNNLLTEHLDTDFDETVYAAFHLEDETW